MPTAGPAPEGPRANHLLGHPPDARLLLLNCDDLGLDESVNLAVIESVQQGIAASCSLMTPCHAAPHALRLLRRHPEIPFGIHLTLVCETPHLRWGPLTALDRVASLLDPTGELYAPTPAGRAALAARARLDHVEREFRAQIEAVTASGLSPTHLDFHCLADGGREDISTSPSPSVPTTASPSGSGCRPPWPGCASADCPSSTTASSTASPSRWRTSRPTTPACSPPSRRA